jgi:hypothetical protein
MSLRNPNMDLPALPLSPLMEEVNSLILQVHQEYGASPILKQRGQQLKVMSLEILLSLQEKSFFENLQYFKKESDSIFSKKKKIEPVMLTQVFLNRVISEVNGIDPDMRAELKSAASSIQSKYPNLIIETPISYNRFNSIANKIFFFWFLENPFSFGGGLFRHTKEHKGDTWDDSWELFEKYVKEQILDILIDYPEDRMFYASAFQNFFDSWESVENYIKDQILDLLIKNPRDKDFHSSASWIFE